jgi:hypothetical protein
MKSDCCAAGRDTGRSGVGCSRISQPFLLYDSFFPNFRVPMVMENCDYLNGFVAHFEADGIGKPVEQCPMDAIFNSQ